MTVSRLQNLFRIRQLMDNPYPNSPSFTALLQQELSCERDIVNATNNTGVAWALAEYQLNYLPGQDSYPINVDDFGKVLYVVKQTTNPYIPWLQVQFQDVSDQLYGTLWNWTNNNYTQPFVLQFAPERMSFFRAGVVNSQSSVSIQPQPVQSCTYVIHYLPGYLGESDPLETSIQLPEHAELVRLRAATALLPYAKWYDDEPMNRSKRSELAQAFAYQLARKEEIFNQYIKGMNRARITEIDSWNSFS